jgi:hypothetical protein
MSWEAPVRFRVSVVVAALACRGCRQADEAARAGRHRRTINGILAGPKRVAMKARKGDESA